MSVRFVNVDRNTPPCCFRRICGNGQPKATASEGHLVHFIVEAIEQLNLSGFKVNETGSGSEQYPPEMMVTPLVYCHAADRISSRVIEAMTRTDVAVRYIHGNTAHPDHGVLCRFRADNRERFKEVFTRYW
jgi:transposase